ncbi:transposase zinc-binding domain-containing protein [uncultured Desulfuromonas sp.]|uniref:transposase zinc-binding domain-containing protein n=1 Tax=uncultured Desulfuromonas sp. TaxID=181013 RepID=UPI0034394597
MSPWYLLAFSCRGRWFCPSCHSKKGIQFGEHLKDVILHPVPHRQYFFSIPIILRPDFKYDRKLLSRLCLCANMCLLSFFQTVLGVKGGGHRGCDWCGITDGITTGHGGIGDCET